MHWRVFEFYQKTAPDIETVRCIDEFANFVKKLHLTLKQSNALTGFRCFFLTQTRRGVRNLLLIAKYVNWNCKAKRFLLRCLGYRYKGEGLTDEMTQTDKQINMLTSKQSVKNLYADCKICRLRLARQNLTEMTQINRQVNMLTNKRNVRSLCANCRICRLKISITVQNLTDWRKQTEQTKRHFCWQCCKAKNQKPSIWSMP